MHPPKTIDHRYTPPPLPCCALTTLLACHLMLGPFRLPVVLAKQTTMQSLQHCVPALMRLRQVQTLFGRIITVGGPPFVRVCWHFLWINQNVAEAIVFLAAIRGTMESLVFLVILNTWNAHSRRVSNACGLPLDTLRQRISRTLWSLHVNYVTASHALVW